jgi:hypothetical protein
MVALERDWVLGRPMNGLNPETLGLDYQLEQHLESSLQLIPSYYASK